MHTHLSPQQIQSFRDNGFVVLDKFLTPDELAEWRAAVDEAVTDRGDLRIPNTGNRVTEETYYTRVFVQRVNLWQTSERVKKLIVDERLGKMATELTGVEGVRIWHDQSLHKAPGANQTSWHLDTPYWSFHDRRAVSIWIALDDATISNGCLYFIPGAYKTADLAKNVSITPDMNALFGVYPEWKAIQPVPAVMKAGQASFHYGLTPHAAGPNMTNGWRRAMTCIFMPTCATYSGKQNILTREQMEKLKVGDLLEDDVNHPVLYRKQEVAAAR